MAKIIKLQCDKCSLIDPCIQSLSIPIEEYDDAAIEPENRYWFVDLCPSCLASVLHLLLANKEAFGVKRKKFIKFIHCGYLGG